MMNVVLGKTSIGELRDLYIGTLSDACIDEQAEEQQIDHPGHNGYFIFETSDNPEDEGITILAKVTTDEAAQRLIELWQSQAS